MRLSKAGYYADFVVYPAVLITGTVAGAWHDTGCEMSLWLLAAAIGVMCWTLAEYILHRFVLHRIAPFAAMQQAHHQAPLDFVGTPSWLSLGVILGTVFLPAWALSSFNTASGLTVGTMAGFFWYGIVHHAMHYRRPRLIAPLLLIATRRHALHHYSAPPGNFGVTTSFWDDVFGTALNAARIRPRSRPARPALVAVTKDLRDQPAVADNAT
jgi:sterol desaturase/sphingolipid hydroxylase (fatty acid hydroxylase superfamily)